MGETWECFTVDEKEPKREDGSHGMGSKKNNWWKTTSTEGLLIDTDGEITVQLKEGCLPKNRRKEKGLQALFTIAKIWKQTKYPSTDKWIKKMWYIYSMEYYSAIEKIKFCHLQQHG